MSLLVWALQAYEQQAQPASEFLSQPASAPCLPACLTVFPFLIHAQAQEQALLPGRLADVQGRLQQAEARVQRLKQLQPIALRSVGW